MNFQYKLVLDKNIRFSALDFNTKNIKFLLEKINIFLQDNSLKEHLNDLQKIKNNLINYLNHYQAFIAFYEKDKQKLKRCIDESLWKTEQLQELYENFKH